MTRGGGHWSERCQFSNEQESSAIAKMTAQCTDYEWPENFRESMTTPTATISDILKDFCSDRSCECAYKKFVALPVPEIIAIGALGAGCESPV